MEKSHCIVGEEIVHWHYVGFTLSFFLHFGMQPADRVHTSRVLSMTVSVVPDAQAELCCLVFAPVNPLDILVHWGMFLVQAISAPNHPFSLSLSLAQKLQISLSFLSFSFPYNFWAVLVSFENKAGKGIT